MELNKLTAHELIEKIGRKEVTSQEIVWSLKSRIEVADNKVKAYVRISDSDFSGLPPASSGVPISIKDNICTEGYNTECCSRILSGFKPPYDATVIKKLKASGANILPVKTNMDEFAFGSSTENSCFGPTCNPWDLNRVPGGSSGGSAAAVASDEAIWALGSDTGGSIRQPASFCGIVGLKPTYGRVSRYGLIAFASSLDQIGPLTKDVEDCALLMNTIAGFDPRDSTSVNIPAPDYLDTLGKDIKGIKIGIPKEYFIEGMDKEIKNVIEEAISKLKGLGAICRER
jgi:aspartyl-tRNA(Asn)/glutamyl-tRNA(Gln) amidotransferase subunit A